MFVCFTLYYEIVKKSNVWYWILALLILKMENWDLRLKTWGFAVNISWSIDYSVFCLVNLKNRWSYYSCSLSAMLSVPVFLADISRWGWMVIYMFPWRQQYHRRYPDEFLDKSDAKVYIHRNRSII